MRNACRKDESRGGIRQCANMTCGKWEKTPREFAKCRRCRKAKYCGKECQSRAWAEGHRFWCSARDPEEDAAAADASRSATNSADSLGTTARRHSGHHHHHHHHRQASNETLNTAAPAPGRISTHRHISQAPAPPVSPILIPVERAERTPRAHIQTTTVHRQHNGRLLPSSPTDVDTASPGPSAQLAQSLVMRIGSTRSGRVTTTSTAGPSRPRVPISGRPVSGESMDIDDHTRNSRNRSVGTLRRSIAAEYDNSILAEAAVTSPTGPNTGASSRQWYSSPSPPEVTNSRAPGAGGDVPWQWSGRDSIGRNGGIRGTSPPGERGSPLQSMEAVVPMDEDVIMG